MFPKQRSTKTQDLVHFSIWMLLYGPAPTQLGAVFFTAHSKRAAEVAQVTCSLMKTVEISTFNFLSFSFHVLSFSFHFPFMSFHFLFISFHGNQNENNMKKKIKKNEKIQYINKKVKRTYVCNVHCLATKKSHKTS